jgi:hypothetical protein
MWRRERRRERRKQALSSSLAEACTRFTACGPVSTMQPAAGAEAAHGSQCSRLVGDIIILALIIFGTYCWIRRGARAAAVARPRCGIQRKRDASGRRAETRKEHVARE